MSDEEEFLQKARTGFEDLCRALNMDEEASTEAWKTYENISRNFTLEGSELHWLACALYVACRSSVPTVGKGTADGNYVSLTRILRCSEMSLIEFFNKMKKWQDMAKLPQDFRQSTDKLERNFTVSAVIFKKYVPIFKSIFKAPSEEPPRVHRSRKQRRHPCTVTEVFNFCWVLFVHAKGNFPMISDDLVNSYHLLLCALDLVFTNALLCNARKDLLNPEFKGAAQFYTYKLTECFTTAAETNIRFRIVTVEYQDQIFVCKYLFIHQEHSPNLACFLFRTCARDPSDVITRRLKDMFDLFSQRYEDGGADSSKCSTNLLPPPYFHLAEALYYRILESIIEREKMILGDADLSCILEQDIFHRSLLACCLEIVIFSYRPPGDFPNVIAGVSPSPTTLLDRYSSPPTGPARRRLFVDPPADGETGAASTGSTSTTSTPPIATAVTKTGQASLVTTIPAGQTVVTVATATVTANNGQTVTIPVQGIANESGGITFFPVQVSVTGQAGAALQPLSAQTLTGTIAVQSAVAKPAVKAASSPLRKGSLSLFFRKVYHLASVRLRDLCAKLDISSELRRKIWTCFEYSLVHCTEMMMDRHLDQLLMCAVYVMAKVTKEDKSFQNIMKCYRTQPQASSNVRNCSLRRNVPTERLSNNSPTRDLIHFYNNVYIKQMRHFALRYSLSSPSSPPLCPYPTLRTGSPRRMLLSSKHSIYISPHKTGSALTPTTPRDKIYYYICSSPPNRLQEINSMIRTGETPTRKRSMAMEEETSPKRVCPDNHSALLRRLQDVANDRSSSH
uniref:Retinoblastoma-like protein 2 n=1 Tax=Stegastes partitus TaxID=144197 RepID=A0A3B5BHC5_9TELE